MGDAFSVRDVQGCDERDDRATALPSAVDSEAIRHATNGLRPAWMLGMVIVGGTTDGAPTRPIGGGTNPGNGWMTQF